MKTHTTQVDGIPITWHEQGTGTPLILIHGIPTCPLLWRRVVPLIENARCLAFEMVGYGSSIPAGRDRDISVARQAEYLFAWARSIGVEAAVLAGHDLGGGVAQIAAVRHPGFCRGLFLTNAIGYDSWPIPSVKALRAAGPLLKHLPDALGKQIVHTLMIRGHDDSAQGEESLELHWKHYAEHEGTEALIRQMDALDVQDTLAVADDLPRLGVPARIAWGAADSFQKIEYGERFAADLAAPLRRIEGGLHFTPEDHPEVVAEEINLLLRTVGTW